MVKVVVSPGVTLTGNIVSAELKDVPIKIPRTSSKSKSVAMQENPASTVVPDEIAVLSNLKEPYAPAARLVDKSKYPELLKLTKTML